MLSFIPSLSPQNNQAAIKTKKTTPSFRGVDYVTPSSVLNKLKKAGLDELAARTFNIQLSQTGDFPYQIGKLSTGKIFVVTEQDRLFMGDTQKLTELPVQDSYRTRCMNNQKRVVESVGGLRITTEELNGIRTSKISSQNPMEPDGPRKELSVVKIR